MKNIFVKAALAVFVALSLIYYAFFTLDEAPMAVSEILEKYQYEKKSDIHFNMEKVEDRVYKFDYRSFDGETVYGQLSYPTQESDNYPVLIGLHAMGRSYPRWWVDSLNGSPTVTQVNKLTELANSKGYVVIAIDARYHGSRKDPNRTLRSIMNDLHFIGNKEHYEKMIHHTVLDHRILLDWIEQQEKLNGRDISLAGYSMGVQIGLLLASVDNRINNVLAIVPPHINDKTALVAPKNLVSLMTTKNVLLVTAKDDEHASQSESDYLYTAIKSQNKSRLDFENGHILPDGYVAKLVDWFD